VRPTAADAQQKKQEVPFCTSELSIIKTFPRANNLDETPLSENRPSCSTQRLNEKSFLNPRFFLQQTQLFRNCCLASAAIDARGQGE
jgi:hypothetical protein